MTVTISLSANEKERDPEDGRTTSPVPTTTQSASCDQPTSPAPGPDQSHDKIVGWIARWLRVELVFTMVSLFLGIASLVNFDFNIVYYPGVEYMAGANVAIPVIIALSAGFNLKFLRPLDKVVSSVHGGLKLILWGVLCASVCIRCMALSTFLNHSGYGGPSFGVPLLEVICELGLGLMTLTSLIGNGFSLVLISKIAPGNDKHQPDPNSIRASWMSMIPEIRDRKTEPIACFEWIASFVIFLLGLTSTIAASVVYPDDIFPGANIAIPLVRIIGGSTGLCMSSKRNVGYHRRYLHPAARLGTQVTFNVLFATGILRANTVMKRNYGDLYYTDPTDVLVFISEVSISCISAVIVITSAYSFYRSVRVQREEKESPEVINVEAAAPIDSKDTESVIPIEAHKPSVRNAQQPPAIFELVESCIALTFGVISTACPSYSWRSYVAQYSPWSYEREYIRDDEYNVVPGANIGIPLVGIVYAASGLLAACKKLNIGARESLLGFHRIMCILSPLLFVALFGCAVTRSVYVSTLNMEVNAYAIVLCEISICCISAKIVIASSISAYRIIRSWCIHETPAGNKDDNHVTPSDGSVASAGTPLSDEQKATEVAEQPLAVTESSKFQKLLYPAIPSMNTSGEPNKPPKDPTVQRPCTEEIVQ